MASLTELSLPSTYAAHDCTPAEHLIDEKEVAGTSAAIRIDPDSEPSLQTDSKPLYRNSARRTVRILKSLIAFATAQYVIVTVLVGLSAIMVASEAGKAINAKLEPIIAALKRI